MASVERYVWSKIEHGYGWTPWQPESPCIELEGASGYWGVYNPDGTQICVCVDRKGAERVLRRLKQADRAVFRISGTKDVAILRKTTKRWVFNTIESHADFGETFATREEAVAYITGCPHPTASPILLSFLDGKQPLH